MSVAGTLFVIGPLGAVVLVPLSLVAVRGRGRRVAVAAWVIAAGTAIAWLASWMLYFSDLSVSSFGTPAPAASAAATSLAMDLCAGGVILLALIAAWSLATARRARTARR